MAGALLAACSFVGYADLPAGDGGTHDARPDSPPSLRVEDHVIALWTFDDVASATMLADTSGATPSLPLKIITGATTSAATIANGRATANAPASRLLGGSNTRLVPDVIAANAVTLEAWAQPASPVEGSATTPAFVAGLASNVNTRDIAITQAGTQWVARVRTGTPDGKPDLVAVATIDATTMHPVVVIADTAVRALYVDGELKAMTAPGSLATWEPNVAMTIFDEPQHARSWLGTVALVAIYDRALTPAEITQNFAAGPDAH